MTSSIIPRSKNFLRFLFVGITGLAVNQAALAFLTEKMGFHYLVSAVIATQVSTIWNFSLSELWVFSKRGDSKQVLLRFAQFLLVNNIFLALRGPLLAFLTSGLGVHYLVSNLISIVTMTIARFLFADYWIWKGKRGETVATSYCYDIHGIIKVKSQALLPELAYFRTSETIEHPDIHLEVGKPPQQGGQGGLITYQESLKNAGFAISIQQGEQVEITVTPLVASSSHVLYTNVIEPVLRWMFVRRGFALLHGACLSFNGKAVLITARTDTGKTTTVLRALSRYPCSFLSDDMLIVGPRGVVRCYPKPLTISAHTLRAIKSARLSFKERLTLPIQSRIHSRSGRLFGMLLARFGLPAATLNAILQLLVPPPKYMIDRLVEDVSIGENARLSFVVLIERGLNDVMDRLEYQEAVEHLVENAEDAYGFPPYPLLADELSCWKGEDLHPAERKIIEQSLDGCGTMRVQSSRYNWWHSLPSILHSTLRLPHRLQTPPLSAMPVPITQKGGRS